MKARFLTLLTTLAFLGFTVCALAGKPACGDGVCKGKNETPTSCPSDCSDGGGGGGDGDGGAEYYDVEIIGPGTIELGGGDLWQYNGRSIDYKTFNRHDKANATLDLTYFEDEFPTGQAKACFGESFERGDTIHSAGVLKRRRSDAHGKFWFAGSTYHANPDDRRVVLYLLIVDGHFESGSPEGWPENGAVMHMDDWELKVENQGADIANMSCEKSVYDVPGFMTVSVYPSFP